MKELLEDYQRKIKTVNEMIIIEKDPHTLTRLKTKSSCYHEFINELERKIKSEKETISTNYIEKFINSFSDTTFCNEKIHPYSIQKGYFPYLAGPLKYNELTPMDIINKVYEAGRNQGIENGKYIKIEEIKKVLDIKDIDD